jgi:hypothetical protein
MPQATLLPVLVVDIELIMPANHVDIEKQNAVANVQHVGTARISRLRATMPMASEIESRSMRLISAVIVQANRLQTVR